LWHNGVFTGAVGSEIELANKGEAISCTGRAGSACLMHSKLLHGSSSNRTKFPRSLYIVSYAAEDAIPLTENPLPSDLDGMIVRGIKTDTVRCSSYSVELPEYPKEVSFLGSRIKLRAQ